ncbi:MAG: hydrolase [Calditrichae bacterium]|nr:hydrolase [Calditrichia bacterium]
MLNKEKTALVVVDIQGKLAQLVYEHEKLFNNVKKTIKGARILGLPIIWLEQNPDGLGPTVPDIAEELNGIEPLAKMTFSCAKHKPFLKKLKDTGCVQVLIVGIETHICVYQTAMELFDLGYEVEIVADAVSSRTLENKNIALQKMRDTGIKLSSVEMCLYELQEVAEGDVFKQILKLIK